ncbi:MAG: tail fiber domain-containing protein [Prolixibacteraceae bacterium]|nr:tail fiber domain-containing protein [Prolixibacteraceae bacterium]
MKKLNFSYRLSNRKKLQTAILLCSLFLVPFCSFSQEPVKAIEVSSSGNCNFGYHVNMEHDLYIGGNVFTTASNLVIGCYHDAPDIYPVVPNTGRIGGWNHKFAEINGHTYYAIDALFSSDRRLKENFRTIETPLQKILKMDGLKYDFISNGNNSLKSTRAENELSKHEKNQLGFIAQDLEKILPEAVFYGEEEDQYYVNYNAIIPVIVEAMKEQQVRIDNLEAELKKSRSASDEEKATGDTETVQPALQGTDALQTAALGQNIPNPFSKSTRIAVSLPRSVGKATLYVYNLQGEQIKSFAINERGNTSVTIEGNSLRAGMYLYSLIADGKEVDTKKLILTR